MVLMISPTCIMISPHGTQITKNGIPHGTEHPTVLMIYPTYIMIFPTVLSISLVLKITPHGTHDTQHSTEQPPQYSRYPHIYHDIPHGTEHPPQYSRYPHMHYDIPHSTEHPHGTTHPHGTARTLYR